MKISSSPASYEAPLYPSASAFSSSGAVSKTSAFSERMEISTHLKSKTQSPAALETTEKADQDTTASQHPSEEEIDSVIDIETQPAIDVETNASLDDADNDRRTKLQKIDQDYPPGQSNELDRQRAINTAEYIFIKLIHGNAETRGTSDLNIVELLTDADISRIREVTEYFLGDDNITLLEKLGKDLINAELLGNPPAAAHRIYGMLLKFPKARSFARGILEAIGWYGGQAGEKVSLDTVAQLVHKAIRLDLAERSAQTEGTAAAFNIADPAHAGKTYTDLKSEFQNHLVNSGQASSMATSAVVAEAFQSDFPDLLVRDIPAEFRYMNTISWVNFRHGVNIAEALQPGSSQNMAFSELVGLPSKMSEEAETDEQRQFIAMIRLEPTMAWALATGRLSEKGDYSKEDIVKATNALDAHETEVIEAINRLGKPAADRSSLARSALLKAGYRPDAIFVESSRKVVFRDGHYHLANPSVSYIRAGHNLDGQAHKMLDIYVSGEWDKPRYGWQVPEYRDWLGNVIHPPYQHVPDALNSSLPKFDTVYSAGLDAYRNDFRSAYRIIINEILHRLPSKDRLLLEKSNLSLYSLRKERPVEKAYGLDMEANKRSATGRFGFIIGAKHADETAYYEVLPIAGVVRRLDGVSSVRGQSLPLDWNAYVTGSLPKAGSTSFVREEAAQTQAQQKALIRYRNSYTGGQGLRPIPFSLPGDTGTLVLSRMGDLSRHERPDGQQSASCLDRIADLVSWKLPILKNIELEQIYRGDATGLEKLRKMQNENDDRYLPILAALHPMAAAVKAAHDFESGEPGQIADSVVNLFGHALGAVTGPLGLLASGTAKVARSGSRVVFNRVTSHVAKSVSKLGIKGGKILSPSKLTRFGIRLSDDSWKHVRKGIAQFRVKSGKPGPHMFTKGFATVENPGTWVPTAKHQLRTVSGTSNVVITNAGTSAAPKFYLAAPESSRAYGPRLVASSEANALRPSQAGQLYRYVVSDDVIAGIVPNNKGIYRVGLDQYVYARSPSGGKELFKIRSGHKAADDIVAIVDPDRLNRTVSVAVADGKGEWITGRLLGGGAKSTKLSNGSTSIANLNASETTLQGWLDEFATTNSGWKPLSVEYVKTAKDFPITRFVFRAHGDPFATPEGVLAHGLRRAAGTHWTGDDHLAAIIKHTAGSSGSGGGVLSLTTRLATAKTFSNNGLTPIYKIDAARGSGQFRTVFDIIRNDGPRLVNSKKVSKATLIAAYNKSSRTAEHELFYLGGDIPSSWISRVSQM